MKRDDAAPAVSAEVVGAIGPNGAKFVKKDVRDDFLGRMGRGRDFKLRQAEGVDGAW